MVSLENNGGFASVRSSPARHDLTGCGCFVIRVRGDGRRYKFTARTETGFDAPLYQCAFETKRGEWEEHRLAFKDFVADLSRPHPDRRAAARSGKRDLGGLPDFRQAGRAISTGGGVDQGGAILGGLSVNKRAALSRVVGA